MTDNAFEYRAIEHFKEYLKIPSVQPDVDYTGCITFLRKQAEEIGLNMIIENVGANKPVAVISWIGMQPDIPSLLLSSHMDVVPVYEDKWEHAPFGAEQDQEGNIYARGAQDMKCVGIQYLEAIYQLKTQAFRPKRTIHICFTPDEEIGSLGMKSFVETETFRKLNVGCGLDEGVASSDSIFNLYYGERTSYKVTVICTDEGGGATHLRDDTVGVKMGYVMKTFFERRSDDKNKLKSDPNLTIGDVTTINLTKVGGGINPFFIPSEMSATFDCRLSMSTDHSEFENWVNDVCKAAGEGVRAEIHDKKKRIDPTSIDDSNPWWVALKEQFQAMEMDVKMLIFPAATDARYIRGMGIPAFGFSPMNNTPIKLHDHDEFLNDKIFLKGIQIYMKIISALANV